MENANEFRVPEPVKRPDGPLQVSTKLGEEDVGGCQEKL
jgi:hypothetical protein